MCQTPPIGSRGLRAKCLFDMPNRLFAASEKDFREGHREIPVRRVGIESDRRLGGLDRFRELPCEKQELAFHVIGERHSQD